MGERIVIDPVARIEGHLKIEVEIENGKVKDAWSSGTMARGIEQLPLSLQGSVAFALASINSALPMPLKMLLALMYRSGARSSGIWLWGLNISMIIFFIFTI